MDGEYCRIWWDVWQRGCCWPRNLRTVVCPRKDKAQRGNDIAAVGIPRETRYELTTPQKEGWSEPFYVLQNST